MNEKNNNSDGGWVKLHRKLLDSPVFNCLCPSHFKVAMTILLMANHGSKSWVWKGKRFTCQPGQFITSTKSISLRAYVSEDSVRGALVNLTSLEFITKQSTRRNSLITICNWETYQKDNRDTPEQDTIQNPSLTPNKPPLDNNINKGKKNIPPISPNEKTAILTSEKQQFESFRKVYPGTKRGLDTEIDALHRHKDWREVLPKLKPALDEQIRWRQITSGFVPAWKNLRTWINQRCWEEQLPDGATTEDDQLAAFERANPQPPSTATSIWDVMRKPARVECRAVLAAKLNIQIDKLTQAQVLTFIADNNKCEIG